MLAVKNTLRFTAVCLPLLIGLGLFLAVQIGKLRKMQLIKSLFLFKIHLYIKNRNIEYRKNMKKKQIHCSEKLSYSMVLKK